MPNSVNDDGDVHIAKINRWFELFIAQWQGLGEENDPQIAMYREAEMQRLNESMSKPALEIAMKMVREFME